MKDKIHPKMNIVKVTCSCGAVYDIQTTSENLSKIEICKECHPFYTGKGKTIDSAGMVEKFKKK